jgi:glycosyltransferase involved in cell wall biosynthesis
MSSENPVFIVGVFRSGTSLLCSLLNQNPKIALMYECDVWNFPRPLLGARFKRNWAERIEFYNQALSRHKMVSAGNFSSLQKIRTPLDLYRTFGERKGATVSGEKSPFYCTRLEQLYRQYPNAFFVLVWRDPVEIYRSVLKAGQTSRFFGKPGMLSRMIYHQDQAIRQAARIELKGAKIFRLDYAALVDDTETVCRDLSAFLGVPFDARMLELNQADLSAIYKAPHHAYLRRGIIERQKYSKELVSPLVAKKLERYRSRWEKLQSKWLKPSAKPEQVGPGFLEFTYHNVVGRALTIYDSAVRAGFEFLPLVWLRVYRLMKTWVVSPPSGAVDEKTSLLKDLKNHWLTIGVSMILFWVVAMIHKQANPHLMFILFYAVPCAILAVIVNTRWATLFVLASSFMAPLIQFEGDADYRYTSVFIWNFLTRFILLEVFILMLGRIRLESARMVLSEESGGSQPITPNTQNNDLKFSIITPSFRNSAWLKLCIASVADQQGVELEHIVQDSCSDDGTLDWLPQDTRVKAFIEKDGGMYDAVNRGYRRATGDILAYLNCDEQYLPGALATVKKYFEENPEVEVLFAGSIVTDGDGKYNCHRHALVPNARHIWFRFPVLTSSIFIRRKVIFERELFFDTKWRDLGDFHWALALIKNEVPMAVSNEFTSTFADTGDNMNLKPNAIREKNETNAMAPAWVRLLKPVWVFSHRVRRLFHGHFNLKPTSYAIYTKGSPAQRVTVEVPKPSPIWWNRI